MADDDPRLPLVHLLRTVAVEWDLVGSKFAALHGLHRTDLHALIHLLDADRAGITATPGWLGAQLGLASPAVTALADRLVRLGLVRRTADSVDRRRVILGVEDRAVELGWSFFGPLIGEMVAATDEFTADELVTVQRFLTMMRDVIARRRLVVGSWSQAR